MRVAVMLPFLFQRNGGYRNETCLCEALHKLTYV